MSCAIKSWWLCKRCGRPVQHKNGVRDKVGLFHRRCLPKYRRDQRKRERRVERLRRRLQQAEGASQDVLLVVCEMGQARRRTEVPSP